MSFSFPPEPIPECGLARYRVLSPNAGVHVSPICLGGMSIGDKWEGMGEMPKESSFKLLDTFFDNGGNFIDTACNYHCGSSEELIGEWTEKRGIRNQLFIATKRYRPERHSARAKVLHYGNSAKNMRICTEASLKKLRTNYIDLYYLHWWDWDTSIEEIMRHLNILVHQGKVLYLGVSDTPAWVVSRANAYARQHGLTPFSVYQGCWNVMDRSFESEIIPMARVEGLALAPWGVLASGKIRTDEEEEMRRKTGEKGRTSFGQSWERTEEEKKICKALEKFASEVGVKHITSVAIAYLMQKTTYVFPIAGGRKPEHLLADVEALNITLSKEQIRYIESVHNFGPAFPNSFIGDGISRLIVLPVVAKGHVDHQPLPEPIRPSVKAQQGN